MCGFPDLLIHSLYPNILGQCMLFFSSLIIYERETKMESVLLKELSKTEPGG